MGAASISEYVALLNEEQQRYIHAFLEFMNTEYPKLTNKISFSMPMWLLRKITFPFIFLTKRLWSVWLKTCLLAKRESDASTSNTAMTRCFLLSKKVSVIF